MGGPGVGKTTLLGSLAESLQNVIENLRNTVPPQLPPTPLSDNIADAYYRDFEAIRPRLSHEVLNDNPPLA